MKKFNKLLIALFITLLSPLVVKAADNLTIDSKSYNENTYELKVSGNSNYGEVMVSLFDGDELLSFKTVSSSSNKYNATFDITFEQDKTITIKVGDINSTDYKISTLNVKKSITRLNNTLTDENGNQLIIKGNNAEFKDNERLVVNIYTMDDINKIREQVKGTDAEEEFNQGYKMITLALGKNELLYYIESFVRDDRDNDADYSSHMSGFTLKLKVDKKTYNAMGTFKLATIGEDGTLSDPITYTYDEENEIFIVNIEQPGILIAYKEPVKTTEATKENTTTTETKTTDKSTTKSPKTGDNIMKYVVISGVCLIGIASSFIYLKKKSSIR